MRIVLQRVKEARVEVDGSSVGHIGPGLLVLLGVTTSDTNKDAAYLADKIVNLRIFADDSGRMNRSVLDVQGGLLIVSQFTLYGDCRKGRRPGFDQAAPPELARELYEIFVSLVRATNLIVQTGIFQAHMAVCLVNDGPVTFVLDSEKI